MTPLEQTLLTLACMGAAWYWGWSKGTQNGIGVAIQYFSDHGLLKDGAVTEILEEDINE